MGGVALRSVAVSAAQGTWRDAASVEERECGLAEQPLVDNPTVLGRLVALELVQLRERAGLDRDDVLREIKARGGKAWSRAKLGHIETARNQPKYADLEMLTGVYGRPDRLDELWNRTGKAKKRAWWDDPANPDLYGPEGFGHFLGLEQGATRLRSWQPNAVHGLLHPKEHAEIMIAASTPPVLRLEVEDGADDALDQDLSPEAVRERAEVRARRQGVLDRADVHIVMGEMALRMRVGTNEQMRATFAAIEAAAEKPNVTVQFLLGASGPHRGQHGPFTSIVLPYADEVDDPGVIYLEDLDSSRFVRPRVHVELYNAVFAELAERAEKPDRTPDILRQYAKELYT